MADIPKLRPETQCSLQNEKCRVTASSLLTYGAETWSMTKKLELKLSTTQHATQQKMMGVIPLSHETSAL